MSIDSPLVGTLWFVAVGAFIWWYQSRLQEVKAAKAEDDGSEQAKQRRAELTRQVTVEGFVGMGSLIAFLYLLTWLF